MGFVILITSNLYSQEVINFNEIVKTYSPDEIIYKKNLTVLHLFSVKSKIKKVHKIVKIDKHVKSIDSLDLKEKKILVQNNIEIVVLTEDNPETSILGISIFNQKKMIFKFVKPVLIKYVGFNEKKSYSEFYFEVFVHQRRLILGFHQLRNESKVNIIQYDLY